MKPDTIYLVVDTENETGAALHDAHGATIHGVPVVKERRLETAEHCEQHGETQDGAYVLDDEGDLTGVPVCLGCLHQYEWVRAVVTDPDELRNFHPDSDTVCISYETAMEAERELRFLIEHSDEVEGDDFGAVTPLARAKLRLSEAGMSGAVRVVEQVGDDTGVNTSKAGPLTSAIFDAQKELKSIVDPGPRSVNIEVYGDDGCKNGVYGVLTEHPDDLPKPFNNQLQEWVAENFKNFIDDDGVFHAATMKYEPHGDILEFEKKI